MRVFVSYARRDRATVDCLLQDIRRARHEVWVDEELTGGQKWWDTILGTIRGADVFVIALSPDWLTSKACAAELQYAVACNRALLPIMVERVSPQMAPPVVANAQILDYLERTPDAAIGLVTAISLVRPAGAPPEPLPEPPPVPMSYMNTYREQVDELNLTFQQQSLLLSELRARMADDDDRDSAIELIRRLRRRGDITESIGKEIDALLAATPEPVRPTPTPSPDRCGIGIQRRPGSGAARLVRGPISALRPAVLGRIDVDPTCVEGWAAVPRHASNCRTDGCAASFRRTEHAAASGGARSQSGTRARSSRC